MQENNNFIQRRSSSANNNDVAKSSTIVQSQYSSNSTNKKYSLKYSSSFNSRTVSNTTLCNRTVSRSVMLNEGSSSTMKSDTSSQTSTTACKQYYGESVLNELASSNRFLRQNKVSEGTKVEKKFVIRGVSGKQPNKNDDLSNIQINECISKRGEHPLPCEFSDEPANENIQQKNVYKLASSTIQANKSNVCKSPSVPIKKYISQINETMNAQSTSFNKKRANLTTSNNSSDSNREVSALNDLLTSTKDSLKDKNEIKDSQNEIFGSDNETENRNQKDLKNYITYTKNFDPIIEVNKVCTITPLHKNVLFDNNIKEKGDKGLHFKSVHRSLSKEINRGNLPTEVTSDDQLSQDFKDIHLNVNSVSSLNQLTHSTDTQNREEQIDKHATANLTGDNTHKLPDSKNANLININVSLHNLNSSINSMDKLNANTPQEEIKTRIKPVLLKWHSMVENSRQEANFESAKITEPISGTSLAIKNNLPPSYVRVNSLPNKIKTNIQTSIPHDITQNSRCEVNSEFVQNSVSSQFSENKKPDKTFNTKHTFSTHLHTLPKTGSSILVNKKLQTSYVTGNPLLRRIQSNVDHSDVPPRLPSSYELPFKAPYQTENTSYPTGLNSYQADPMASNQVRPTSSSHSEPSSYQTGPVSYHSGPTYQVDITSSNQTEPTSFYQTGLTSHPKGLTLSQTGPTSSYQAGPESNSLTSIDCRVDQMSPMHSKQSAEDSYTHSDLVVRQQISSVKTSTCQKAVISERSMIDNSTLLHNSYSKSVINTSQQTQQKFFDSLPQSLIEDCQMSQNDVMIVSSELLNSLLMGRNVRMTETSMEESHSMRFQETNDFVSSMEIPTAPPLHMFQNHND